MFLIWLCKARKDTGESMASRLLAQRRTTFSPVWWIFSVSWSTAMLLGAQTSTGLQRVNRQSASPRKAQQGPMGRLCSCDRPVHPWQGRTIKDSCHLPSHHQLNGNLTLSLM